MPELPEVEGVRRRLEPLMTGKRIERLDVLDPKLWHAGEGLSPDTVAGRSVEAIQRHAKILDFALSGGLALLLHLKIAGQIAFQLADGQRFLGGHPYPLPNATLPEKSTRFAIHLEEGSTLFVNDQRRFAWLRLLPSDAAEGFIAEHKFGPDPLDDSFTPPLLAERLRARKGRPLKAALLDQTCIAGIGNIYADESLHAAKLHPMMRAGDLADAQVGTLHQAIVDILALAVPVGGAIVKSGRAVQDADSGRDFLRAHGRAGERCPDCGQTEIIRAFLAGRGTYFCPDCQPAPSGFVLPQTMPEAGEMRGEE